MALSASTGPGSEDAELSRDGLRPERRLRSGVGLLLPPADLAVEPCVKLVAANVDAAGGGSGSGS